MELLILHQTTGGRRWSCARDSGHSRQGKDVAVFTWGAKSDRNDQIRRVIDQSLQDDPAFAGVHSFHIPAVLLWFAKHTATPIESP